MSNQEAVGRVIDALYGLGRLEVLDDARVQAAVSLARMVDEHPENPALWREYRAAEASLRNAGTESGDAFADLLAELSAQVGDGTDSGTEKPGAAARDGRGASRAAVDAVATPRRRRGIGTQG